MIDPWDILPPLIAAVLSEAGYRRIYGQHWRPHNR